MLALRTTLVLLAVAALSVASRRVPWTKMYVTYGPGGEEAFRNGTAFFPIPLTAAAAADEGWVEARVENFTSLWCLPDDPRVCLVCDLQGSIAGMQIAFPEEDLEGTQYNWREHPLFAADVIFGQRVARGRFYLVPQYVLQSGGRSHFHEIGSGLWLQNGDSFTKVPMREDHLEPLGWTRESCTEAMGRHYFFNISTSMDCRDFEPYFILTDNQKGWVQGLGFEAFGRWSMLNRNWYEITPPEAVPPFIPNAPDCLIEWTGLYQALSAHFYFIDEPYLYTC